MRADYPLKFETNIHTALWGQEEWLVSNHPSSMGVIANGRLKGKRLCEVYPEFPLLIKVIDARTRLSVQVHPNERTAQLTGGEPKTEMWCLLADGCIYAGLRPSVREGDVVAAVEDGSIEGLMVSHEAKRGQAYFIPGGLVHAIGDRTRLFEVQQSSNTTYRLYDWRRVDAQGRSRELHLEQGKKAIDYTLAAPVAAEAVDCEFFRFGKAQVRGESALAADEEFKVVYVSRGKVELNGEELNEGECALLPPMVAGRVTATESEVFIVNAKGKQLTEEKQ